MADTKEYKSVAVDLPTYSRLKKLAEDEHRNVLMKTNMLVRD